MWWCSMFYRQIFEGGYALGQSRAYLATENSQGKLCFPYVIIRVVFDWNETLQKGIALGNVHICRLPTYDYVTKIKIGIWNGHGNRNDTKRKTWNDNTTFYAMFHQVQLAITFLCVTLPHSKNVSPPSFKNTYLSGRQILQNILNFNEVSRAGVTRLWLRMVICFSL